MVFAETVANNPLPSTLPLCKIPGTQNCRPDHTAYTGGLTIRKPNAFLWLKGKVIRKPTHSLIRSVNKHLLTAWRVRATTRNLNRLFGTESWPPVRGVIKIRAAIY